MNKAKKTRLQTARSRDKLAGALRAALEANPQLTINLLASQLDTTVQEVHLILDEYFCHEDGIEHSGPGLGGNWVPLELQLATTVDEPTFIGYRHPDGTLQAEPYEPPA